jgi:predicted HAD superfamily Cof-like phosphohydrolase
MFEEFKKFNVMYSLPHPAKPTVPDDLPTQVVNFTRRLRAELDEGFDIIEKHQAGASREEVLTDISDWLLDLLIYCGTEAAKYGLPSAEILQIIMQSNFSKLGADGKPIKDEFGTVKKGPNYWKPEPKIMELLKEKMK